jgi:signal transduction histidine kinase
MRALIFELRPEALSEEGLVAALRKHAGGVSARADISVEIEAPDVISLPVEVEEQLYRVVQEALNNVAKHARATAVGVRVASTDDGRRLLLEVSDDGCGFELASARPGHMGLTTMRQRIERLGGRLEVSASAGAETTVRAVVPLHTAAPGSSA